MKKAKVKVPRGGGGIKRVVAKAKADKNRVTRVLRKKPTSGEKVVIKRAPKRTHR